MSEPGGTSLAEKGSGSALALSIACAMMAMLVLVVPLYSAFAARSRLAAAADAAALAAADSRSGFTSAAGLSGPAGEPCALAAAIAGAAGAGLGACEIDGLVVTVVVRGSILGLPIEQTATAGPPPAESENRRIR